MQRIDISREEFIRLFGIVPPPFVIGMCFTNVERTEVVQEYVFTDEPNFPDEPNFSKSLDIAELERLFDL